MRTTSSGWRTQKAESMTKWAGESEAASEASSRLTLPSQSTAHESPGVPLRLAMHEMTASTLSPEKSRSWISLASEMVPPTICAAPQDPKQHIQGPCMSGGRDCWTIFGSLRAPRHEPARACEAAKA